MGEVKIEVVDPQDDARLLRWNAVLREGYASGRRHVWSRSDDATRLQFQNPHPTRRSVLLLADIDGVAVGAAEAHVHPGDPAEVEIAVRDDHRRRGIGGALLRAVREALRPSATVIRAETYSDDGVSFALSAGLRVGSRESRQIVGLPISEGTLADQDEHPGDIDIRSWSGPCPDELLEGWARLRSRMSDEVPMGTLTRSTMRPDVQAVRRNEQRMSEQGYILVRSLARAGEESVGYTEILLSRSDPEIVHQDDTFVEERVRGRGVGRALKVANARLLMSLPESTGARILQTYTEPTNTPMLTLNRSFGFEEADVLTVLEGPLA